MSFGNVVLYLIFVIAIIIIFSFPTMWLWNWLMPVIFKLPQIDLWHIGLMTLISLLNPNKTSSNSK
jgi:hypothetical protein